MNKSHDSIDPETDPVELPMANRPIDDVPGHWLLARLGKRVLRPGGRELTDKMLAAVPLTGADVVELAPGLGWTARAILARQPSSYTGVDQSPEVTTIVQRLVGQRGRCIQGEAANTGLPTDSADVVVGEAMLTMQTDRGKSAIIAEAVRVLRSGGHYAVHELGLQPDDLDRAVKDLIRTDLAKAIRVNARPLTVDEWRALLASHGLVVESVAVAPMALLQLRRNLADEGAGGVLRILINIVRTPGALRRLRGMQQVFRLHRNALIAVALTARLPSKAEIHGAHITDPTKESQ